MVRLASTRRWHELLFSFSSCCAFFLFYKLFKIASTGALKWMWIEPFNKWCPEMPWNFKVSPFFSRYLIRVKTTIEKWNILFREKAIKSYLGYFVVNLSKLTFLTFDADEERDVISVRTCCVCLSGCLHGKI
jgi:hypothetical protein